MKMEARGDLVINGFGSSNGGEFQQVTLNGFGTINNDVDCVDFDCNGVGTVNGNIKAEKARINGKSKIKGTITSNELTIDGTANFEGNLFVETIKISGRVSVGGKVKSEEIQIKGSMTVGDDCEAEIFQAESQFKINGLLNADQIDIKIYGPCKAKEIGGQTIMVRKHNGSSIGNILKPFFPTQLDAEIIEGDTLELECTNAKIVRGSKVKIGAGSTIGLVEYTDELEIDKNANVKENRKIV
jgi:cytoskeletal protein CcmA (bactofilin family)